ncbi:aminodeoxychorismate/anthranilate synthase component II [Halorubellus sp. JP-L1]|uniref:anthranilate synthase component II n=1 Tax=Halorubellus sp. JP-L1 TaxID=2715753 RepID=UPI001408A91E|nr:aminodeoxychorismate/anthranilate synthase component II [Halorubellus sp. JP-L1]NHN42393.1 aminodeoxychorismate/anthranilate synthase component II [Halorubellus sp. JP-L1]
MPAKDGAATEPASLDPVPGEPRVLVVDNYDSFAYNLVQYVGEFAGEVVVRRNDAIDVEGVRRLDPDGIVVSPGPGTPADAGVSMSVFEELDLPALGVCLGHQALCAANGARVGHAPEVVHGKPSIIAHDGAGVFEGLPERLHVGRYHSLAVERGDLPASLSETAATATDEGATLMAVRHREKPHVGVQFHPESILTGDGTTTEASDESTANEGTDPRAGARPDLRVGKRLVRNFLCSTT